jgi:hypothetical protein
MRSQELEAWRLRRRDGAAAIEGGAIEVVKDEPLKRELEDFVAAVRTQARARREWARTGCAR